jgi:C4-dicarboxylate-specific signal transduction histidine kinase
LREILKDIVDEDKRAGEVIQRLRLLLKKGEISRQPLDLNEVVLDVLKIVRSDLVNRDMVVETELETVPAVMGDRVQVQQVLLNLLTNACDAMVKNVNGDRSVVVRTRIADDSAVRVSVEDRGEGISAESLGRIFEPFVTTKSHGMGLGLAVCRTIVTAHGGTLSAVNNTGRGARFDMILPTRSIP